MSDEAVGTEVVSLVGLLDQLNEVPEPPPISMMPETWGWLLMAALLLIALVYAGYLLAAKYRANAYRRAALADIDKAGDDPAAVALVLRRTALAAYPRDAVASLSGVAWLGFLDRHYGGKAFSEGVGAVLADGPYRDLSPVPGLSGVAREWIRKHRRDAS